MCRLAAKNLKFLGASRNSLEQIIHGIWQRIDPLGAAIAVIVANSVSDLFTPENGLFFAFSLSLLTDIFSGAKGKKGQQAHYQNQRYQRISPLVIRLA